MKIGIVMPVLHYFEGAIETIESATSGEHDLQVYIGANWREKNPLSVTWNNQIERARLDGCDYILVVNDDILFAPSTIDEMVRTLHAAQTEGYDQSTIMTAALNLRSDLEDPYQILHYYPLYDRTVSEAADFSCFMVVPDVLELVGKFDENIRPAYFEDNDYHYRMKLLGYKCVTSNYAPYYHFGSRTQNGLESGPVVPGHQFESIRSYYMEKWGGSPGEERYTKPWNNEELTPRDWQRNE